MLASVFELLNRIRTIAEPEQADVDVTGLDLAEIGAIDGFGSGTCVFFPQPAFHLIVYESSLYSTSFVSEFCHFTADKQGKWLISCHNASSLTMPINTACFI